MNVSMAVVFGSVAGAIGAAAWAALAYFANLEIGWLAWGIGGLVGYATAAGSVSGNSSTSNDVATGPVLGIVAVLITIVSICVGKYAMVEIGMQQALAAFDQEISEPMSDEVLVSYLADEIGQEKHGEDWYDQYKWPENPEGVQPDSEALYPAELWKPAQAKWEAMSADEQAEFRQTTEATAKANVEAFAGQLANQMRQEGFLSTFGAMDLLFFGLAVATAWGVAGSGD